VATVLKVVESRGCGGSNPSCSVESSRRGFEYVAKAHTEGSQSLTFKELHVREEN